MTSIRTAILLVAMAALALAAADGRRRPPTPLGLPPNVPPPRHILDKLDFDSPAGSRHVSITDMLDDPAAARNATKVNLPNAPAGLSDNYAGFVTTDADTDSNMFFWFFEALNGDKDAPVVVWLQGGPGGTSLFGLFYENGPLGLTQDLDLFLRNVTWSNTNAMLYIDNPVGTGFSFSDPAGYSYNQTAVAENLYGLLTQFFTVFDDYADNDFYVAGESYGGKYVPAICAKVIEENQNSPAVPINLKGASIGDGLVDPASQLLVYSTLFFSQGVFDYNEMLVGEQYQGLILENIKNENWPNASRYFNELIDGNGLDGDLFSINSGCVDYFDVRDCDFPVYGGDFSAYVNQSTIRSALHVGDHYFQSGNIAVDSLQDDLCKSEKDALVTMLETPGFKTLLYNGNFDAIVQTTATEVMLEMLDWSAAAKFNALKKVIWHDTADASNVWGYVRGGAASTGLNLTHVAVRNCGHIAPYDQPEAIYDMFTRFVEDKAFA